MENESNYDFGREAGQEKYKEELKKQRAHAAAQDRVNEVGRDLLKKLNIRPQKDKPKTPEQPNMFK